MAPVIAVMTARHPLVVRSSLPGKKNAQLFKALLEFSVLEQSKMKRNALMSNETKIWIAISLMTPAYSCNCFQFRMAPKCKVTFLIMLDFNNPL